MAEQKTHRVRLSRPMAWTHPYPGGETLTVKRIDAGRVVELDDADYQALSRSYGRSKMKLERVGDDVPVDFSFVETTRQVEAVMQAEGKATSAPLVRGSLAKLISDPTNPPMGTKGGGAADALAADVEPAITKKGGK